MMSTYWKQSLWLGGVYWLISLIFWFADNYWASLTDFLLSLFLTLFLIPMNWLKPINFIEKAITRFPICSTFLVAVGWIPYFSIFAFLVATIITMIVVFFSLANVELFLHNLVVVMTFVFILRQIVAVVLLIGVAVAVLFFKITVAGKLNRSLMIFKKKEKKVVVSDDEADENIVKEKKTKTKKTVKKTTGKKTIVKKTKEQKKVKKTKESA